MGSILKECQLQKSNFLHWMKYLNLVIQTQGHGFDSQVMPISFNFK